MELNSETIIETARKMTGLQEFESESFKEGLEILLADVAEESRLTDSGRQRIMGQSVMQLANRLQVDDWIRNHPEVLDEPIHEPLFVCGMPRTGTTLAIDLLHADPARRCLINWEAKKSVPPPEPDSFDSDPRLIELRGQLAPALAGMKAQGIPIPHWEEADDPTECIFVLAADFRCLMWGSLIPCRRYNEWILETSAEPAYRHLERVLQVLQSKVKGRWTLKMPSHALNLPSLKQVFPDARVVVTHRDPYKTLGSLCSMIAGAHSMYMTESDVDYVREVYPAQLAEHANRPMGYRDEHGDEGFLDLLYADLVKDPLGEMKRIYEFTGDAWTDEVAGQMQACLERNPKGKHGAHRYDLAQYGLDPAKLEDLFEPYRKRYDVPLEGQS
ncbi:MAG: sulfotransferase [Myxococcota bacterium]